MLLMCALGTKYNMYICIMNDVCIELIGPYIKLPLAVGFIPYNVDFSTSLHFIQYVFHILAYISIDLKMLMSKSKDTC